MRPLTVLFKIIHADAHLPWMAALAGMVAVSIVIYSNYGIINNDGILYIEVAKRFSAGDWESAIALYRWPFYPALISVTHAVSGLNYQLSAHLLTVVFFGFTSAGLTMLVKELGGEKPVILASALLLLTSPYIMESMPPMIIRDHGLACFHIWSLIFFLRFYQSGKLSNALLWGGTASVAVLFRIEALTYMALLPLTIFFKKDPFLTRCHDLLKANIALLSLIMVMIFVLVTYPSVSIEDIGRLGDPAKVASSVWNQLQQGLSGKADIYADKVLGNFLDDYALIGLIFTLLMVLLSKTAISAGWVALLAALYAAKHRIHLSTFKQTGIMQWLFFLGVINATFILLSVFVLSSRYLLPVSMIIIAYGAFGISAIFNTTNKMTAKRHQILIIVILVAGLIMQACYIFWAPSKQSRYEIDAAHWLQKNAPPNSRIYFDHGRLRYYYDGNTVSRDTDDWDQIIKQMESGKFNTYDYVVFHVSNTYPEQEKKLNQQWGKPVSSFDNRQKRIVIFHVKSKNHEGPQ